jgi:uncharacterized protein (TIRG00374 family)
VDQKEHIEKEFSDKHQEVLKSIRLSRIILPVLIGIGVVIYLLYRQFDPAEFAKIDWTSHTLFWVLGSLLVLVVRHLAYAYRLRVLSNGAFSWRKCIELIFIWEFSSAVSPTSVGGSAVAFFILAQEKLSTAKTATIVLYTIVLDTIFFVGFLPILFLIFGTSMIRPDMNKLSDMDGWGVTFVLAYALMAVYGAFFYYGLFINPNQMKRILVGFTRIKFLSRFRRNAVEMGNDMILASKEMKRLPWTRHLGAFMGTAVAWSCRFILLNFLIIAFVDTIERGFWDQFAIFARLQAMFVIIAFSPTPGGSGFVEILFGGFLSDYVSDKTAALVISFVWRILAYYSYLLAGAIIIPNWIRKILNARTRAKAQKEA